MNLLLPRVLNTFDRLGQVSVALPDGFDVRGPRISGKPTSRERSNTVSFQRPEWTRIIC